MHFWTLAIASSVGDIASTIELAIKILSLDGEVETEPILAIFSFLIDRDESFADKAAGIKAQITADKMNKQELKSIFEAGLKVA